MPIRAAVFPLTLLLAACIDYEINKPPAEPGVDSGGLGECDGFVFPGGEVPVTEACIGSTGPIEVTDPWNATIEYQYTSRGHGVAVMPAVGNLTDDNGDGLVNENDMPDIAFTVWGEDKVVALHGDGSGVIFEATGFMSTAGVAIADVDGDGAPEVVAIARDGGIAAVRGDGTTLWRSVNLTAAAYAQPTVCDLDGDGTVEVIADIGIANGEDGTTVAILRDVSNSYRAPVCADLDQDGQQEILLGNRVYDSAGERLWSSVGAGSANFAAVVDVDGDDGGEVFFVTGGTVYLHDDNGAPLTEFSVPGGEDPGPPCAADFDGDGAVELAVPNGDQLSVFDPDGTLLWSATMHDYSGLAGCSGYDVNGDGAYEVLFADEVAFRIYDGATGTVRYENTTHASVTIWEYPVVADVDADGSAEIVVADNDGAWRGITVYGHAGDGWPRSGPTWGIHDFAVTNLDPDGHVPTSPEPSWLAHNVFRARPAVDDPSTPDLVPAILDLCVADCDTGPVAVSVEVANHGGRDVRAGAVLALYADDDGAPRLVATATLPEIPAGSKAGVTLELALADVGTHGLVAVVDDDGSGLGRLAECDETNNVAAWRDLDTCQNLGGR